MITDDFTQALQIGQAAPDFLLRDTDGNDRSLSDFADSNFLVVIFTCNHCPYVLGSDARVEAVIARYKERGVGFVGINSNDAARYPQDSYEFMQKRAPELGYTYLHDPSQAVARHYGAQLTPEFFIFDADRTLCWHGTIDDSPRDASKATTQWLDDALEDLTGSGQLRVQTTQIQGCSVKWLEAP